MNFAIVTAESGAFIAEFRSRRDRDICLSVLLPRYGCRLLPRDKYEPPSWEHKEMPEAAKNSFGT